MRIRGRLYVWRILFSAVMIFLSFIILSPIAYTILSSFKTKAEVNRALSLPSSLYLENFIEAWTVSNFPTLFINSVLISFSAVAGVIIIGAMAAYPLSRRKEKIFSLTYMFFLSAMMIPFQAGMIPLYRLVQSIGLMNNRVTLILLGMTGAIPMTILIYSGFIKTVPRELEEAALIDGSGYLGKFFIILFPLLKPATGSVIILNLLPIWNDFFTPFLFLSTPGKRTLPTGIYSFIGARSTDYGPIYAISMLTLIVPVIVFLSMQKYFYKGIVAGAVKG